MRERLHSNNVYKNHLYHFFWSLWCPFASNTADFEVSISNLTHKVPPNTSIEIRKSLKRMPSLAYTEMDQTNWSAAYALCVLKLRYNQNCPFLVQRHNSDFQEPCVFSVTSFAVNDVNVRGGNVIKNI